MTDRWLCMPASEYATSSVLLIPCFDILVCVTYVFPRIVSLLLFFFARFELSLFCLLYEILKSPTHPTFL